jgi:hypothetical protein
MREPMQHAKDTLETRATRSGRTWVTREATVPHEVTVTPGGVKSGGGQLWHVGLK